VDASFWQYAFPQFVLGVAVPFFFIPTTSLTLSAVLPEETASAAGLQNFLRTTSAAFATSIMTTAWDNTATAKRTVLAGALPDPRSALDVLTSHGLMPDQALHRLDALIQLQSVMLSTNQMFLTMAAVMALAAGFIWLAPKPRKVELAAGGH
jgi:DHA2 family multidrug resistance protein